MARDSKKGSKGGGKQLDLPLKPLPQAPEPIPPLTARVAPNRSFRIIRGEGKRRDETLKNRDDVARLLVSSAADMLLKRITTERANEIQVRVDRIMRLFDRVDRDPIAMTLLRRELDDLELLWREGKGRNRSKK